MTHKFDINQLIGHACNMIERGIGPRGHFFVKPTDAVDVVFKAARAMAINVTELEKFDDDTDRPVSDLQVITERVNKIADERVKADQAAEKEIIDAAFHEK